jgi:hypothetical protein
MDPRTPELLQHFFASILDDVREFARRTVAEVEKLRDNLHNKEQTPSPTNFAEAATTGAQPADGTVNARPSPEPDQNGFHSS